MISEREVKFMIDWLQFMIYFFIRFIRISLLSQSISVFAACGRTWMQSSNAVALLLDPRHLDRLIGRTVAQSAQPHGSLRAGLHQAAQPPCPRGLVQLPPTVESASRGVATHSPPVLSKSPTNQPLSTEHQTERST